MQIREKKLKIKSLNDERVMLWVKPKTRTKLMSLKAKEGYNSVDSLINDKLFK